MKKTDFGRKLIEIRKTKGLTQEEIAEKCHISSRTIQRIESGSVNPRAFTIKAISKALDFNFFESTYLSEDENFDSKRCTTIYYLKDLFNLKKHTMKKVSILAVFVLVVSLTILNFTSTANAQQPISHILYSKDRIEVSFTNTLTFDSLVHIKHQLESKGITIRYRSIKFNIQDQLVYIDCSVDCNDGYKGEFASSNLSDKNKRFGFYRDYSNKTKSSFGTGAFEQ